MQGLSDRSRAGDLLARFAMNAVALYDQQFGVLLVWLRGCTEICHSNYGIVAEFMILHHQLCANAQVQVAQSQKMMRETPGGPQGRSEGDPRETTFDSSLFCRPWSATVVASRSCPGAMPCAMKTRPRRLQLRKASLFVGMVRFPQKQFWTNHLMKLRNL